MPDGLLPHVINAPPAARRAVPGFIQPWSITFDRLAPGFVTVAENGVVDPPMYGRPGFTVSAVNRGPLGNSVTGTPGLTAMTVEPCSSCTRSVAVPGVSVPPAPLLAIDS